MFCSDTSPYPIRARFGLVKSNASRLKLSRPSVADRYNTVLMSYHPGTQVPTPSQLHETSGQLASSMALCRSLTKPCFVPRIPIATHSLSLFLPCKRTFAFFVARVKRYTFLQFDKQGHKIQPRSSVFSLIRRNFIRGAKKSTRVTDYN